MQFLFTNNCWCLSDDKADSGLTFVYGFSHYVKSESIKQFCHSADWIFSVFKIEVSRSHFPFSVYCHCALEKKAIVPHTPKQIKLCRPVFVYTVYICFNQCPCYVFPCTFFLNISAVRANRQNSNLKLTSQYLYPLASIFDVSINRVRHRFILWSWV